MRLCNRSISIGFSHSPSLSLNLRACAATRMKALQTTPSNGSREGRATRQTSAHAPSFLPPIRTTPASAPRPPRPSSASLASVAPRGPRRSYRARSPLVGGPPRGGSPAMRRPINEDGPPSTSDEESEDDNFDPTDELVPCRPQREQPLNAEGTAPLKWSADSGEYDGSFKKRSPERHERRLAAGARRPWPSALVTARRASSRPPAFAAKSGSQRSSALAALSDLSGPKEFAGRAARRMRMASCGERWSESWVVRDEPTPTI